MSISTYSELKTALARWGHRSDLTADLDEIISLAEARLNSKLRLVDMEVRSTATASTSSRYLGYPSDMLEILTLTIQQDTYFDELIYLGPDQLRRLATTESSEPQYYTVRTDIEFDTVPDQAYTIEIHYIQKLALSDTSPTNDVLTNYPNIYLYAGLLELAFLIEDTKKEQRYADLLGIAIIEATQRSKRKRGIRKQMMQSEVVGFNRSSANITTDKYNYR